MKIAIFSFVIIFSFLFVTEVYAQIEIGGLVGGFKFIEFDYEDEWATSGWMFGGRIGYNLDKMTISAEISDVKASDITHTKKFDIKTESHLLTFLLSNRFRFVQVETDNAIVSPFIGVGIGITNSSGKVNIGWVDEKVDETDFTYKLSAGIEIMPYFFTEFAYLSGGRRSNTGVCFSINGKYSIPE